jgi:hypothetical protein
MVEMTTSHKQPALLVLFVKHSVAIATDAHQLNTMLFIRTELSIDGRIFGGGGRISEKKPHKRRRRGALS